MSTMHALYTLYCGIPKGTCWIEEHLTVKNQAHSLQSVSESISQQKISKLKV